MAALHRHTDTFMVVLSVQRAQLREAVLLGLLATWGMALSLSQLNPASGDAGVAGLRVSAPLHPSVLLLSLWLHAGSTTVCSPCSCCSTHASSVLQTVPCSLLQAARSLLQTLLFSLLQLHAPCPPTALLPCPQCWAPGCPRRAPSKCCSRDESHLRMPSWGLGKQSLCSLSGCNAVSIAVCAILIYSY